MLAHSSLQAAGYLPQIWTPDAATERERRLAARRYQVVRHRTRLKNEVCMLVETAWAAAHMPTTSKRCATTRC